MFSIYFEYELNVKCFAILFTLIEAIILFFFLWVLYFLNVLNQSITKITNTTLRGMMLDQYLF